MQQPIMPIGKQKTATAIAEKEYDGDHLHCDVDYYHDYGDDDGHDDGEDDGDDYHDDGDDVLDDGESADIMG